MLPLEFRVAGLFVMAAYGAVGDILLVSMYKMDLLSLYSGPPARVHDVSIVAHRLALLWVLGVAAWFVGAISWSPLLTLGAVLGALLWESRFRHLLQRILLGGLSHEHRLGDILVSDTLVSFAPILVDLAVCIVRPQEGRQSYAILAASFPQAMRMKQCILDYRRSHQRQHLFNFGKYFVGNISPALRIQALANPQVAVHIPKALAANAIYSLIWDLHMDWKLTSKRHFRFASIWYVLAAIADTFLRFAWMLAVPTELCVLVLQAAELFRRWIWVIFRLDSEDDSSLDGEIELTNI